MDDDSEPGWDVLLHVLYGHAWGIRAFSEAANAVTQELLVQSGPGPERIRAVLRLGRKPGT